MVSRFATVLAATFWHSSYGLAADDPAYQALDPTAVLVTVNEQPITKGDLEFELLWRRVPPEQKPAARRPLAEELIDRKLVRAFLGQRRVDVPEELIDRKLQQLRQITKEADRDFDDVITNLGFTEESLRAHLELPLAWRLHLNRVVTESRLREFFEKRREQFDGTRVRASQIVIAVPSNAGEEEWRSAEQVLTRVRREIAGGKVEFGDAARSHSTSPSREDGGDLGFFTFRGTLPSSIASEVFSLEVGELSRPLRTEYGVHLLLVTDRIAGQLSLEDVRARVLDRLSERMWGREAERLRSEADIKWTIDPGVLGVAEP